MAVSSCKDRRVTHSLLELQAARDSVWEAAPLSPPSLSPSLFLSVCLPACLPVCVSVCLPACLSVWLRRYLGTVHGVGKVSE